MAAAGGRLLLLARQPRWSTARLTVSPAWLPWLLAALPSPQNAGMDFDLALRMFMDSFRPPGEGQKIDRIMQARS